MAWWWVPLQAIPPGPCWLVCLPHKGTSQSHSASLKSSVFYCPHFSGFLFQFFSPILTRPPPKKNGLSLVLIGAGIEPWLLPSRKGCSPLCITDITSLHGFSGKACPSWLAFEHERLKAHHLRSLAQTLQPAAVNFQNPPSTVGSRGFNLWVGTTLEQRSCF
jgi:hypothetical protein